MPQHLRYGSIPALPTYIKTYSPEKGSRFGQIVPSGRFSGIRQCSYNCEDFTHIVAERGNFDSQRMLSVSQIIHRCSQADLLCFQVLNFGGEFPLLFPEGQTFLQRGDCIC